MRWVIMIVLAAAFFLHVGRSVRLFYPAGSLLSDQPLLTDDNSMHSYYSLLGARLIQKTGEPYGYVPDEMAGHPKTAIFDAGILPVEELMARVSFVSPFVVYKLFVLLSMIAVAICAFLSLWLLGVRDLALCLGWFVLMFHYWWGQGLVFTMGGMNSWLLAASLALLLLASTARLIKRWSLSMAGLWIFLVCVLPYIHPIAIVPILLSTAALVLSSKQRGRAVLFVVLCGMLSLAVNRHWIQNTYENRAIATPFSELAGGAESPRHLWGTASSDIKSATGLAKFVNRLNIALFNGWVVAAAVVSLVWLKRKNDPRFTLLLVWTVALAGLTYFSGGISALQNLQPWRLRYPLLLACSVSVALIFSDFLVATRWRRLLVMATGIFAVLYFFAFEARRDVPRLQVGFTPAQQTWVDTINSKTDGRGRILAEDGLGFEGIGVAALHLGTHAQWIGGPYRAAYILHHRVSFVNGMLAHRDIASFSAEELSDFFRRYNVHWVLAWTSATKGTLDRYSKLVRPESEMHGLTLYELLDPADSFFENGSGELTADLDSLRIQHAAAKDASIVLRYHFYKELAVDGGRGLRPFPVPGDPGGFIEVLEPGDDVVIRTRH